jgi:hypothetical protein
MTSAELDPRPLYEAGGYIEKSKRLVTERERGKRERIGGRSWSDKGPPRSSDGQVDLVALGTDY